MRANGRGGCTSNDKSNALVKNLEIPATGNSLFFLSVRLTERGSEQNSRAPIEEKEGIEIHLVRLGQIGHADTALAEGGKQRYRCFHSH